MIHVHLLACRLMKLAAIVDLITVDDVIFR